MFTPFLRAIKPDVISNLDAFKVVLTIFTIWIQILACEIVNCHTSGHCSVADRNSSEQLRFRIGEVAVCITIFMSIRRRVIAKEGI